MTTYGEDYFTSIYDASGEARKISQIRAQMLVELVPGVKRILDVGCGYGDFLFPLRQKGIEVAGVDISTYALKQARKRVKGEFHKIDVAYNGLPFSGEGFDAVTIFDVVEHINSSDLLFSEVFRVLSPGGLVFLTTPNHQGRLRRVTTRLFPDDPTHVNVQNAAYWKEHLVDAGFENIEIKNCLLHGLPPLPAIRRLFRKINLPVYLGPIFLSIAGLCGTLYLFARKS